MVKGSSPVNSYTFMVTVNMQDDIATPSEVASRLADSLTWIDGVVSVDVDCDAVSRDEYGPTEGTC